MSTINQNCEIVDVEDLTIKGLKAIIHPRLVITEVSISRENMFNNFASLDFKGKFYDCECIISINTEELSEGSIILVVANTPNEDLLVDPLYDLIEDHEAIRENLAQLCRESVVKLGFNPDGSQIN